MSLFLLDTDTLTLFDHNARDFGRVPRLLIVDWTAPPIPPATPAPPPSTAPPATPPNTP